jgi:hypothetical protein
MSQAAISRGLPDSGESCEAPAVSAINSTALRSIPGGVRDPRLLSVCSQMEFHLLQSEVLLVPKHAGLRGTVLLNTPARILLKTVDVDRMPPLRTENTTLPKVLSYCPPFFLQMIHQDCRSGSLAFATCFSSQEISRPPLTMAVGRSRVLCNSAISASEKSLTVANPSTYSRSPEPSIKT